MTEVQPNGAPSSRFRDLLDLVTIVNSEVINADAVAAFLEPVLFETAAGTWSPELRAWQS